MTGDEIILYHRATKNGTFLVSPTALTKYPKGLKTYTVYLGSWGETISYSSLESKGFIITGHLELLHSWALDRIQGPGVLHTEVRSGS